MEEKHTDDIEVELKECAETAADSVQLPVNFIAAGNIENDDVRVYIRQSAYKKIEQYAQTDKTKELGSILIGSAAEEHGKVHVVICDCIEAKYTDASVSTLTFTHETWDYVHSEQAKNYPDKKIVGWQHTHPDYGVFLSNYDMFIHENFFNLPFQIAYVVDPVRGERGFFQWKNGKVEKLGGFYIYDDVGVPIKIEQSVKKSESEAKTSRFRKLTVAGLFVLLAATLALAAAVIIISNRQNTYLVMSGEAQTLLQDKIDEQQAEIEQQKDTINKLSGALSGGTDSGEVSAQDLARQIEDQQSLLDKQEEDLTSMKTLLDSLGRNSDGKIIYFAKYTVVKGDTLLSVCKSNNIDYKSNRNVILAINGIENEDLITVGQTILLPAVVVIDTKS